MLAAEAASAEGAGGSEAADLEEGLLRFSRTFIEVRPDDEESPSPRPASDPGVGLASGCFFHRELAYVESLAIDARWHPRGSAGSGSRPVVPPLGWSAQLPLPGGPGSPRVEDTAETPSSEGQDGPTIPIASGIAPTAALSLAVRAVQPVTGQSTSPAAPGHSETMRGCCLGPGTLQQSLSEEPRVAHPEAPDWARPDLELATAADDNPTSVSTAGALHSVPHTGPLALQPPRRAASPFFACAGSGQFTGGGSFSASSPESGPSQVAGFGPMHESHRVAAQPIGADGEPPPGPTAGPASHATGAATLQGSNAAGLGTAGAAAPLHLPAAGRRGRSGGRGRPPFQAARGRSAGPGRSGSSRDAPWGARTERRGGAGTAADPWAGSSGGEEEDSKDSEEGSEESFSDALAAAEDGGQLFPSIFRDGEMVSEGSRRHPGCRPCSFFFSVRGCRHGGQCGFCHLSHPSEKALRLARHKQWRRRGSGARGRSRGR